MAYLCDTNEPEQTHNTSPKPRSPQPSIQPSKHSNGIKFSIDNILSRSKCETETKPIYETSMVHQIPTTTVCSDEEFCDDIDVNDDDDISVDVQHVHSQAMSMGENGEDGERFSWLHCTRYKPPKLPRSKRKDVARKRKLGRNPRVPFTQHQVSILENKFRQTHYLSSVDVAELSAALNLTETRVKIWFQNRRARERRDKSSPGELSLKDQTSPSAFQEKSTHLPSHHHPFSTNPVATAEEHGLTPSMNRSHPLQSMFQSHWSYYQALQGLYCYRTLPTTSPFARSLQYYDVTNTQVAAAQRNAVAVRQSAFGPVAASEEEGVTKTQVSM